MINADFIRIRDSIDSLNVDQIRTLLDLISEMKRTH